MSVPRSMHRMVTVPRGRGTLAMMKRRNGEISGMLLVSVYAMDFFKLSKMSRPAAIENIRYIDILMRLGVILYFYSVNIVS